MVSLGFSSLRARRNTFPLADVQETARRTDIVQRRHTSAIKELADDIGLPDLNEDEDIDGLTIVSVSADDSVESTKNDDDDDDDDDDNATTTTSSSPSATATVFPTTLVSETLTTTLPTLSSSQMNSASSSTGTPVQPSLLSTCTGRCETVAAEQQTQEPGGYYNDNNSPGGWGQDSSPRPGATGPKVAIAFGAIGAAGLIVALIWAAILIRRSRRRRRRRHSLDKANPRDYPSRIGQHRRLKLNFNIPPIPRLPFSFASPLVRFHQPDPNTTRQRRVSSPSKQVHVSSHINATPDSSNLNEGPQAADRTDGGESDAVPKGWLDEKRHDPSYPLPLLDPEPVQQASVRKSVVSWFKRSSKHHPLRLNPLYRKSSLASTTSHLTGDNLMSRPGSMATTSRINTGYYTDSRESVVAEGGRSDSRGIVEELPPMPDLGLPRIYTNDPITTPAPADSAEESVTAPPPAFTREDARAYYKSMWAESSSAGNTERLSTVSSLTDSTVRTSTQGVAGRESIEQAGLSPPPGYASPSVSRRTTQTPVTATAITEIGSITGSPGTQTRNKEELYAVYEQM